MQPEIDLAMLDASEWQYEGAPTHERDDEPRLSTWIDRSTWGTTHYTDTGARSSDRAEWLEARRSGIGASEIAMALGESPWGDAGTVYARKVRTPTEADAEWLEWGLRLEEPIATAYASSRYAGRRVTRDGRLLRSREHPWAITTLDAWTETEVDGVADVFPLELKTDADRYGRDWEDGLPAYYAWQLQHQMLVTGARRASIACLLAGSRLVWSDVERDEQMIRRIVHAGEALWHDVARMRMPETADHAALASVFGREDHLREIELSGVEWVRADIARCEADAAHQRAAVEKAALDARIKRAMGRAEVARLDDGTEYRWKTDRSGRRVLRRREARNR